MGNLQVLNPDKSVVLVLLELQLPIVVEVLHMLLTNRHILSHLRRLNVLAKLVLEVDNFSFQQAHFFHKILV